MSLPVTLSNDHLEVEIAPEFGARITRLVDRTTGRDWLVSGACEGGLGDDAPYLGEQARGWDECFPTVAPCQSAPRDHGDLWGRPHECEVETDRIHSRYRGNGYRFDRTLILRGSELLAQYEVHNIGDAPLEYLYSQHCLLKLTGYDRIGFTGVGTFNVSAVLGQDTSPGHFEWPRFDDARPDLRNVEPKSSGWAMKAYAPAAQSALAWVESPEERIAFSGSGASLKTLGLWLCYGGWPSADNPGHQVALELTTAPADDLDSAKSQQNAQRLAPAESATWSISITTNPQKKDAKP